MSGGAFDYAYSRTAQFADDLELRLHEAHTLYGHEVAEKLAELVIDVSSISRRMHAAEWLFSGDIGEDTFMERMSEK